MNRTGSRKGLSLILFTTSAGWAGLSRILSDVSCGLPEGVHQTIVLLENRMAYPHRAHLRILGENCSKRLPIKGLRILLNAMKFRKLLKELKPDAILVFHHDARAINYLAQMSLPMSRCKTIIAALDVPTQYKKYFPGSRNRLHNLLVFLILKHAHRIIATAEAVKSDLVAGFRVENDKIDVVYAGVDSQKVREMASDGVEHPWFSENIPIVVTSGRFIFQKNQADLLKAFALVVMEKSCRLVLVGDGVEKSALSRLAGDLGIADSVLFLGYQNNPFKYVARCSIFAFPSLFDAQPLVLLETMAVGCPIVAYDCPGGTREMLAPGTKSPIDPGGIEEAAYGLLVPTGNVEALAKAIGQLLDDPQLRGKYSRLGRERATHFSIQDMAENYFNAIANAVSLKGSSAASIR